MDYHPWTPDSSYVSDETLLRIDGTPHGYKDGFLKLADNTAAYFYILCVAVIILGSFLICLPLIVSAMTS